MPAALASPHWPLPSTLRPSFNFKGWAFLWVRRDQAISSRLLTPLPCESERCLVSSPFLLAQPLRITDTHNARLQEAGGEEGSAAAAFLKYNRAHCPLSTELPAHCKGKSLIPQARRELAPYGDPAEILGTPRWRGRALGFFLQPAGSSTRPRLPTEFRVREGGEGLGLARGAEASAEI